MVFYEPISLPSSKRNISTSSPYIKRKLSSSLIVILLLTSMFIVTVPISTVNAQPDGFEYFVFSETQIKRLDEDMDGHYETARIYYDVDSTTAYAEIRVVLLVYDDTTDKLVKELSETYTIFRTIELKETYFDFHAGYSGIFNFTLEVYDEVHNHQEYGGNDYPIGIVSLEINPNKYDIIADATPFDADADGYNDDARIKVTDTLNFTISDASVYIDGEFRGKTNDSGMFLRFNTDRGIHEVDVFFRGLHANTDFKSEGTGQEVKIYADADPFDDDMDGYVDDVVIRAYAYNYYTLPNADVYIDWVYYGTTNQEGLLYAYNFDLGFHNVYVSARNLWTETTFYAEAENKTDIDIYFFNVRANVVALNNDVIANDLDIYLDVDVEGGKTANVTVNATLYFENRTVARMESIKYSTTGYQMEDEHIYIYNLTSNLTYNLKCELFDEQSNLEDVWYIDGIVVQVAFGKINVDTFVVDMHDDNHLNDVVFWAHIKNEGYTQANIYIYKKNNNTPIRIINTSLRDGYGVVENLLYINYTWEAYDKSNNSIDNGTFELYDRNPLRTVQVRVRLYDSDFDNFFDDFEAQAYDERNLPDNNVTVKIINVETQSVVVQGFTSAQSSEGFGRFLAEDLPEGYYTYKASIEFGIVITEYHLLSTGWFYSYGNSTESTHNLNAYAQEIDFDGDGYINDVRITVKDRNDQPVMNAMVYFDNDYQNTNTTDQNGMVIGTDFEIGWHDVNVVFLGGSQTVPTGAQAYTRFFSEGFNFNEYFWRVNIDPTDGNEDGEWNDINISMDVDVNEFVTVEVTVEIEVHYSINDTMAEFELIQFEITGWDTSWDYAEIYNLTYNESYYLNITLKDEKGNIEDRWDEGNLIIAPIKPNINIELLLAQIELINQTFENNIYFYAHILNKGIEKINISVYFKSNDTLVYFTRTFDDGYTLMSPLLLDGDYYFIARNSSGNYLEYGEFNIGNHPASIQESQTDLDNEGYYDDYFYVAWEWNVSIFGITEEQINLTVDIYDIYNQLVVSGNTADFVFKGYNFTEGFYKFIAIYQSQRVSNGTFYSYGNGFVNSPPVAVISSPSDSSEWTTKNTISFDGSGSYDPDGNDIITFYWVSNISGPMGYSDKFSSNLPEGVHEITLFVDDGRGSGHNVSSSVTITVKKPLINDTNEKPIANAGPDQSGVPLNSTVKLDGSGSKDNDGYITEYNWTMMKKPQGSKAKLNKTDIAKSSFFADIVGIYECSLGVKDNESEWSVQEDIVLINVTKNSRPIANISTPIDSAKFNTTDIIFFNATGTYDPDNDTIEYLWTVQSGNGTPVEISTLSIFNSTIIAGNVYEFKAGIHVINLTVTDSNLANASMEISINISNVPPIPNITNPMEDEMLRKYVPFYLDGRSTEDPDNTTNELYFSWEVEKIGGTEKIIFTNNSYPYFQDGLTEGYYKATLWVHDSVGTDMFGRDHNVSAVVNFTVENQAPVADAGEDMKINQGDMVTFNASDSYDPDGERDEQNFIYEWDFDDGNTDEGIVVNHTFKFYPTNIEGNYTVTLTITDTSSNFNNTATNSINITINRKPKANAGADKEAEVEENIELDGSSSTDPDGDKLTYKWTFENEYSTKDTGWRNTPFYNLSFLDPDITTVTLHVNDSMAVDNSTIILTIVKLNSPPICIAGNDILNVDIGEEVSFSGENCYDVDTDDILEYTWDFGDDSIKEKGINVTHIYQENGEYTVTLNITDGEAYKNDTLTVSVRPKTPIITYPTDGALLFSIDSIYGSGTGKDISKIEVRIGNKPWKSVSFASGSDNNYDWSIEWDTTKDNNGEYSIQVRAMTSYAESKIKEINVNVSNVDLEITSHQNNDKVNKEKVTISGTASGLDIETVEVKAGDEPWTPATDTSIQTQPDWSTWQFVWDTSGLEDGDYTILVRLSTKNSQTDSDDITLEFKKSTTVDKGEEKEEPQPGIMDLIRENQMIVAAGLLIIIFLLLILFLVTRKRKRQRELMEKEEEIERLEEDRVEKERIDIEKLVEERQLAVTKQPVRCPRCKEYSVIEDDGERPLMIECVHCGARGFISEKAKTLDEPKLPKGFEEEDKLIIQCPKCDEMFTTEDEMGEIVCPNCGVRGQLNEETIEELKKQQEELKERMKEQQEQEQEGGLEKKEPRKSLDNAIKGEKRIKCPNCDSKFTIPLDAKNIECPSCGATGSL